MFTRVTTHLRTKRAAVVLYALILFGLVAFAAHSLVPNMGNYRMGSAYHFAKHTVWVTPLFGLIAILIVAQVARGRLDGRLNWILLWLGIANLLIVSFFLAAFWRPLQGIVAG